MTASQEILNSIEDRLLQLEREIAALQSARDKLQSGAMPGGAAVSEEEWLERRTAELAARSRRVSTA
jgi:hypothetical protein